jgi:hypothetical protein
LPETVRALRTTDQVAPALEEVKMSSKRLVVVS